MFKKLKGFTLIELLIVIAIIAILTVAFLPTLRGGQTKARDAAKKALINNIVTVFEQLINDGGNLPDAKVPATSYEGDCIKAFDSGAGLEIAKLLSRVPQGYASSTKTGLCPNNNIWYKNLSNSSYILAIEMENSDAANVKKDVTATTVQGWDTITKVIEGTNEPVGTGDTNKYYYAVAK